MKTLLRIRIILPILLVAVNLAGAISDVKTVKGRWIQTGDTEDSSFQWQASWIWLPGDQKGTMMLARKSFHLGSNPEEALLRISASSRYELTVNGTFLCRGPARSAAHHQSYDILDVTSLLRNGNNVIAVQVHYQPGKQFYQYADRGGLLVQINMESADGREVIVSDDTWKVVSDPSWSDDAPPINRFQDFVNDRVDFRLYPENWDSPGFDDSRWEPARQLYRNYDWPAVQNDDRPHALTEPWTQLIPRDIPYLNERDIPAEDLILFAEITDPGIVPSVKDIETLPLETGSTKALKAVQKNWLKGGIQELPESKEGKATILIFDFGEVVTGLPELVLEGPEGTMVDVMCAPYMLDKVFTCKIVDSECLDRIILSGKKDEWRATYFKPARYMAIAIRGSAGKIRLHYAGIRQISYPFEDRGKVWAPGAQWIENYWEASKKTIEVCTSDGYTDNYRERRQYAQTGYYAALGNYWAFGDYALQRRYLLQVAQEQQANGIMPAYAPLKSRDYMVIFDSNCLWIRSLYNYFLYSGDSITIKSLLPSACKLMELFHVYTDEGELLTNPPYAYWLDHALLDRRGANFTLNGHYLGALEDFAELLEWLGDAQAGEYRQRAAKLRNSLQQMWDPERQLFADARIDGTRSEMFSEHSNAMALALHIASREQAQKVAVQLLAQEEHDYVRRESGLIMVTPAMSYFLHKGLNEYGWVEESFAMFRRRFDKMLSDEYNGTLWEEWYRDGTGRTGKLQKKTRSDAQTESAFPPALIAEYIFGLRVTSPGMKKISFLPRLDLVDRIKGEFPTPEGMLSVSWDSGNNGDGRIQLTVPGDLVIVFDLAAIQIIEGQGVWLDGQLEAGSGNERKELEIGQGNHTLILKWK